MFDWTGLDISCRLLYVPVMEDKAKFMCHSNKKVIQKRFRVIAVACNNERNDVCKKGFSIKIPNKSQKCV